MRFYLIPAKDEKRGGLEAVQKLKDSGMSECDDFLLFHQLDVVDPDSIASLADFVKTHFGKLDILLNYIGP
ncbi:carbonyl reductase, putative [Ricinus communis]|uniref:Carbonyl reductase, putative n=1 Tax=Ricinus communis TaxID=3988 RepID=B9RDN1_RICCO|nr:carbonyl reductase, putative [Ricinus communis]